MTGDNQITAGQVRDWAAGKVEIKDLIGLAPAEVEGLQGRAQFFLEGRHDERALIMLEMLEELDRTDPLPSLLAIEVLLRLGQSDAAEEKIATLLQRRPDDPEVLVAQAELLIQTGQLVPAAALLERVLGKDSDAKTPAGQRARAVAARASALFEKG